LNDHLLRVFILGKGCKSPLSDLLNTVATPHSTAIYHALRTEVIRCSRSIKDFSRVSRIVSLMGHNPRHFSNRGHAPENFDGLPGLEKGPIHLERLESLRTQGQNRGSGLHIMRTGVAAALRDPSLQHGHVTIHEGAQGRHAQTTLFATLNNVEMQIDEVGQCPFCCQILSMQR
jgi:hypothetical protein